MNPLILITQMTFKELSIIAGTILASKFLDQKLKAMKKSCRE